LELDSIRKAKEGLERQIIQVKAEKEEVFLVAASKEKVVERKEADLLTLKNQVEKLKAIYDERENLLFQKESALNIRETLLDKIGITDLNIQNLIKNQEKISSLPSLDSIKLTPHFNSTTITTISNSWVFKARTQLKTYALYRILYGADFIEDSILSIIRYVDKVFLFWDDTPWGNIKSARYKGKTISIPDKIDNVVGNEIPMIIVGYFANSILLEIAQRLAKQYPHKIVVEYDHVELNTNQITHLINDLVIPKYGKPDLLLFVEWDHVWREDQLEKAIEQFLSSDLTYASSHVKECYRTPRYFTKDRDWRYVPNIKTNNYSLM
jgi:hypothetical protein